MELHDHLKKNLIKENIKINNSHTDTSKMSSKEKNKLIESLEDEVNKLNTKLSVTEDMYKRYVSGLILEKQRFEQISIITLPSGKQIFANELTSEQLELIESTLQSTRKL